MCKSKKPCHSSKACGKQQWEGTWLEAQVFYVIDVRATRLKKEWGQTLCDQAIYQIKQRAPIFKKKVYHNLGNMSVVCWHCDAFHWMAKKLANNTFANLLFGTCFHNIKITLPLSQEPSHSLQ